MRNRIAALALLFAIAISFMNLFTDRLAAVEDDLCGGCFIVAQWYWENTVMSSQEILDWLELCLELNDC